MNKHRVNAWVKRALRKQLRAETGSNSLNQYQPGLLEDLEAEYGMDNAMRHGSSAYINSVFIAGGEPIPTNLLGNETRPKKTAGTMAAIVKQRFGLGLLLALSLSGWNSDPASAAFHLQDFDTDGNPEVVSYEELRLFLIYNQNIGIAAFDAKGNRNGILDGTEVVAYNRALEINVNEGLGEFFYSDEEERIVSEGRSIPIDQVLGNYNLKRKVEPKPLSPEEIAKKEEAGSVAKMRRFARTDHGLYVRGNGKDVSIRSGSLDNTAAKVSYAKNNKTDIDVGRIKGAIGYLFSGELKPDRAENSNGPILDAYTFGGSIEVDRSFDSRGRAFETDKLTFRLGGDLQFSGVTTDNIPTQYLTNWVRYQTDSRFDSRIYGFETIYEPYTSGFGKLYAFDDNLKLITRFTPTLRSDYTFVDNDPNNNFLVDEFWNFGFGASLRLSLTDDNEKLASFVTTYERYWDVLSGIGSSYSWENELSFPLVSNSDLDVTFSASHILSKNAATGKKDNKFGLGIGVKF